MTVLLETDDVTLLGSGGEDEHGWSVPGDTEVWSGRGNLQLDAGATNGTADELGGRGPFNPRSVSTGQLFLPLSPPLADGQLALIRGAAYVVSQARRVLDPTDPTGGIGCQVCTVSEVTQWPG